MSGSPWPLWHSSNNIPRSRDLHLMAKPLKSGNSDLSIAPRNRTMSTSARISQALVAKVLEGDLTGDYP